MYVVAVTPLIRGTQLETLSYYSPEQYQIGSFLEVPIRGKQQRAIVTDIRPVTSSKTALKSASYSLRKLPQQKKPAVLPATIIGVVEALTSIYPASVGSLLYSLLPPDVRSGVAPYPTALPPIHQEDATPQVITARIDERYMQYQTIIRSAFAKQGSILFVVPQATEVKTAVRLLSHGIEDRLIVFSTLQTKRQRAESYARIKDSAQPLLVITTPQYAFLERHDFHTIVVEHCASNYYHGRERPYLDYKTALILLAKVAKRAIIFGDTVLPTEFEVARREERYLTIGESAKRIAFSSPLSIITQKDKPKPDAPFQLFSQELTTSVKRALEGRGHVFFYAARRGLAPVIACIDCGHIFRCPDSNTPYSLVRTYRNGAEERWFVSSTSGRRVPAADVCTRCGSWRLRERGIGIQYVYDEWQKLYPEGEVFLMDSTTVTTAKQAEKVAKDFFASTSGVLIGTQIALPYLTGGVDVSAVISLDATRSIPTWRADEGVFRLLLQLRECTKREVIVQSRMETDSLLVHASRGALERFYDEEIALREMLHYPPFSTFILLTWTGTEQSIIQSTKLIEERLDGIPFQYYNNPNSQADKLIRHGLLRIATNEPTTTILEALRRLPPFVKIEINPERIV